MSWKLAPSLEAMRAEANRLAPKRSKASDGTIGDQAHAKRTTSDHNVGARDLVHALDLTNDPAHGIDVHGDLFERIRARRDPRVKYLISNGRICGPGTSAKSWAWRPYTGANRHDKHGHISIWSTLEAERDTRPWFSQVTPVTVEEDDVALVDVLADPQAVEDQGGWALLEDGTVRPFRGARDLGQPKGHDYWGARKAKRFEPSGGGYTVIATSGERYDYG